MGLSELTEEERQIIEYVRSGKSVIINCNFGYAVKLSDADDGRARIDVDPDVEPTGVAKRFFMEHVARKWLAALALEEPDLKKDRLSILQEFERLKAMATPRAMFK